MHGVSRMVLASHMIMSAVRPYAQTDPVAPNSRALWRHKVAPSPTFRVLGLVVPVLPAASRMMAPYSSLFSKYWMSPLRWGITFSVSFAIFRLPAVVVVAAARLRSVRT